MIYLIDDDKSVRRGLESFRQSTGMKYRSSESVEEFLSLYRQYRPDVNDLIVLDLSLPG